MLHGIITRHPFWDGNKRTAFLAAETILFLGNMRFDIEMQERFDYCLELARRAEDAEKNSTEPPSVEDVESWIRESSVEMNVLARFLMWTLAILLAPFWYLREIARKAGRTKDYQ